MQHSQDSTISSSVSPVHRPVSVVVGNSCHMDESSTTTTVQSGAGLDSVDKEQQGLDLKIGEDMLKGMECLVM